VKFSFKDDADYLEIILDTCPFRRTSNESGLERGLSNAYMGFGVFCTHVLTFLNPSYQLIYPPSCDTEDGLLSLIILRSIV